MKQERCSDWARSLLSYIYRLRIFENCRFGQEDVLSQNKRGRVLLQIQHEGRTRVDRSRKETLRSMVMGLAGTQGAKARMTTRICL